MFGKKAVKINEALKCQAIENVRRDYGFVNAQSVAIEYNRLLNMDSSKIRMDEKCSNMGNAGR
jgi:hypothetical protein